MTIKDTCRLTVACIMYSSPVQRNSLWPCLNFTHTFPHMVAREITHELKCHGDTRKYGISIHRCLSFEDF